MVIAGLAAGGRIVVPGPMIGLAATMVAAMARIATVASMTAAADGVRQVILSADHLLNHAAATCIAAKHRGQTGGQ